MSSSEEVERLRAELAACRGATRAALKASTAQILLLQRELIRAQSFGSDPLHQQSTSFSCGSGVPEGDLHAGDHGGGGNQSTTTPTLTSMNVGGNLGRGLFVNTSDEDEVAELRKQVRHLELEVSYNQRLAVGAQADKDRFEREVLNLRDQLTDVSEEVDFARHQVRHYEIADEKSAPAAAKIEAKLRKRVEEKNSGLNQRVQKLTIMVSEQEVALKQYQGRYAQTVHQVETKQKQLAVANLRISELKQLLRQHSEKEMSWTIHELSKDRQKKLC